MSTFEKLVLRFSTLPVDFSYQELCKLLFGLGFEEDNKGKTSGSRIRFYSKEHESIILLHKPHGNDPIGKATMKQLYSQLTEKGFIKMEKENDDEK